MLCTRHDARLGQDECLPLPEPQRARDRWCNARWVMVHRLTVEAAAVSQGDQQSSADHAEQ